MFLRQSTSQVIRFGPMVDDTDGKTEETVLTIAQADMQLSKDGGAFAQKNTTGNATHDADGWYSTTLDTTDTATVGELYLQVNVSGALPIWVRWYVVEEAIYDKLFAASGGLNDLSAAQVNAEVDTALADYDGPTLAELQSELSGLNDPTAGAIADAVWDEAKAGHVTAGSFGEEVQAHALSSEVAALNDLSAAEVNAEVDTALADYDGPTLAELQTELGNLNDPTAATIADAVWDEAKAGHVSAGSFGEEVQAHALSSEISALNDLSAAQVNAEVDTALADYDGPTKAELDAGLAGLNDPTAEQIADEVWNEPKADHTAAGSFGEEVQAHALSSEIGALDDPSAEAIANAVWDEIMEAAAPADAQTARQWFRIMAAVLMGKTGDTGTWSALSVDGNTVRIAVTLNSTGQRTSIDTLDGS